MKFSGRKIESGMPGTPLGNPIASLVGSTRVFSFKVGHRLGGGSVLCINQSRKAFRNRFTSPVAGTGLARNVPLPQLLPGQPTPVSAGFSVVAPLPPPCVEPGRSYLRTFFGSGISLLADVPT